MKRILDSGRTSLFAESIETQANLQNHSPFGLSSGDGSAVFQDINPSTEKTTGSTQTSSGSTFHSFAFTFPTKDMILTSFDTVQARVHCIPFKQ